MFGLRPLFSYRLLLGNFAVSELWSMNYKIQTVVIEVWLGKTLFKAFNESNITRFGCVIGAMCQLPTPSASTSHYTLFGACIVDKSPPILRQSCNFHIVLPGNWRVARRSTVTLRLLERIWLYNLPHHLWGRSIISVYLYLGGGTP